MEAKLKERIEATVLEILEKCDMNDTTEYQIRKAASEKLDLDLNKSEYKALVRQVVNSFLEEREAKEEKKKEESEEDEEGEEEEGGGDDRKKGGKEYTEDGDLVICNLSSKRKVTIQDFRGTTLVSIREYYYKGGKELPTAKGISLKEEQWAVLKKTMPAIDQAVKKMQARV